MASLDQGMLLLFQEQKGQRVVAGDWSTYSVGSSLKCCLERGFALWQFSTSVWSHFVPQSRRRRENFISTKLAIPRRLCSTWGLPWSLPSAMRTRDRIAGALACGRKLSLSVLQALPVHSKEPAVLLQRSKSSWNETAGEFSSLIQVCICRPCWVVAYPCTLPAVPKPW